jgi:hypothetical protein
VSVFDLYILIQACRERREREQKTMANNVLRTKMEGALQSLKMLQHNVETDTEEVVTRVAELENRRKAAMVKTHASLDSVNYGLGDIQDFVEGLEALSNAAPNSSDGSGSNSGPRSSEVAKKP